MALASPTHCLQAQCSGVDLVAQAQKWPSSLHPLVPSGSPGIPQLSMGLRWGLGGSVKVPGLHFFFPQDLPPPAHSGPPNPFVNELVNYSCICEFILLFLHPFLSFY